MKRQIIAELAQWRERPQRKPLLLKGARQVGKTWALEEFGRTHYADRGYRCHYIDLRKTRELHPVFAETLDPHRIIEQLGFHLHTRIDTAHDLVVLDEIQDCPNAVASLKYFGTDLPELAVAAAGSHLGLMSNEEPFPVGKVNFLHMFPMTFSEFVAVLDAPAHEHLRSFTFTNKFPPPVHTRLLRLLTLYIFTGGLPEVVATLTRHWPDDVIGSISGIRAIQNELVLGYRADFAKYSGVVNANHINHIFEAVPTQLSKTQDASVRRFHFKNVVPKRKGFDSIRGPLTWLQEARLCIRNSIARKAEHPLHAHCSENRFKVFLFDIGILNCLLNLPGETILRDTVGAYKGFILENFVAQELFAATNATLLSWQEGTAELEFLVTRGPDIMPVDVKSAARSRRAKSLDAYIARYAPPKAFKLTRQNLNTDTSRGITTAPVYCSYKLPATDWAGPETSLPLRGS